MRSTDQKKDQRRIIKVRVHPRAKRDHVEEKEPNCFTIWTTAPPEKGKANEAARRLLAQALGIAPTCLELRQGATSREKVFELLIPQASER